MADDPSSVALPLSPLIVATLNNTDIKDVSMPETEMKNRQEMANFMLNDDAHNTTNCDGKTLLSGTCSATAPPLFSLFAAHNNIIKDVHISENSSKKGQKLSNKSISDIDIQDQDNNIQGDNNTSLPDAPLEFLAVASLARPSFANNSLKEGTKSRDACGQGKSTLREVRQKLANCSISTDATDKEAISAPALSHNKLLNHNKGDQNQQQSQQSIPFIKILNIITGKVPFPHPNTSNTNHTLVMDEEHLKDNNSTRLSTPAAVAPSTCSDHSNISSSDGTTRGAWTAVSPKKKRSKKATEHSITLQAQGRHPNSPIERYNHPQPVTKRISFGLPTNPYATSKPTTKVSAINQVPNSGGVSTRSPLVGNNKLEGIVSQSFLCLTVDNSSQQGNDKNILQTIRSIIKIILHSADSLSVIPPAYQDVPAIRGNKELPTRDNVKLMHRYMHQALMSPTYFSGKLLVGHLNGHTIHTEEVTTAIKTSYPAVQISLDKFGLSKIVNLRVLCGTFQQESRQALTKLLEAALHKPGSLPIPLKVTWESIYTRGEHQPASTKAHFIKSRMEDMAWATLALYKLYGSNITEYDPLRPLVRFIHMSALKSSDNATRKVITHQLQFLKSTCMASFKKHLSIGQQYPAS